jgi:hypothetical protein
VAFMIAAILYSFFKGKNILEIEWTGITLNKYFVVPALFAVPLYIWALLRPVKISISDSVKRFFCH